MRFPAALPQVEQRVAALRRRAEELEARQLQLQVRATLLVLLHHITLEVAEHCSRHGDGARAQVLRRRVLALAGGGGGSCAGGFEARLQHVRPGASLLHLGSVSTARVSEVKAMTGPELATALSAIVVRIKSTAAAAAAAPDAASGSPVGPPPPSGLDASSSSLHEQSKYDLLELYNLALIWNLPAFMFIREHRWDNLQSTTDPCNDASLVHWDIVVQQMGMSREQALLGISVSRLLANRLASLRLELRGILHTMHAMDEEAGRAPGSLAAMWRRNSSGGAAGGMDAAGVGGEVSTAEELVFGLEANARAEELVRWESNLIFQAMFMPMQFAKLLCACYPFPYNGPALHNSVLYILRNRPEDFPWAGPPMHMGSLDAWELTSNPTQQTPL